MHTKTTSKPTVNVGESKGYFEAQKTRLSEAKKRIGQYAVKHYLAPGDSIVIDAGSSLWPIASAIAEGSDSNYTVMTHNFRAFTDLQERAEEERHPFHRCQS